MDKIEPARPLVLTRDQHALLGEIVEIVGQIEGMLIQSAEKIDAVASAKLKGLTATPQAKLWAETVAAPVSNSELPTLIQAARDELIRLAEDRNDFIHALYKGDYADGYFQPGYQTTSAHRSKTGNRRSTLELKDIRDRAAALSCSVAQIAGAIA
jgi:hypothetical protein